MLLPGQGQPGESEEPRVGGVPDPNMWFQQQVAGPQNLNNPQGTGLSPFSLPFFTPPGIPATSFNLPWSGLPPAGGFIPFTPFMLPATYYMPMSFQTNQGWPFVGGMGGSGGGGGTVQVSFTEAGPVTTTVTAQLMDFTAWTIGNVTETSPGVVRFLQPASGGAGNLAVNNGVTTNGANGPLLFATGSGTSFSGNITIGLNYDTTSSFDASSANLKLQDITLATGPEPTVPGATFASNVTVDGKGRVTQILTREIGLFKITKTTRTSGNLWWSYTLKRVLDGQLNVSPPPTYVPVALYPFTEVSGPFVTGYNGLEANNPNSGTCYGLTPVSTTPSGTGPIPLAGTYAGFEYNPVPEGTIVLAFKEGTNDPRWWFTASNPITGECPEP